MVLTTQRLSEFRYRAELFEVTRKSAKREVIKTWEDLLRVSRCEIMRIKCETNRPPAEFRAGYKACKWIKKSKRDIVIKEVSTVTALYGITVVEDFSMAIPTNEIYIMSKDNEVLSIMECQ